MLNGCVNHVNILSILCEKLFSFIRIFHTTKISSGSAAGVVHIFSILLNRLFGKFTHGFSQVFSDWLVGFPLFLGSPNNATKLNNL